MAIRDIIFMIITSFNVLAFMTIFTALIKLGLFKIFRFLPTKQLFKEYIFMHAFIIILIVILVIFLKNYSISGIFRITAPIYGAYSVFDAFYTYDRHLTFEPINQYLFSIIISSLVNMFLLTFLIYQSFYIFL